MSNDPKSLTLPQLRDAIAQAEQWKADVAARLGALLDELRDRVEAEAKCRGCRPHRVKARCGAACRAHKAPCAGQACGQACSPVKAGANVRSCPGGVCRP